MQAVFGASSDEHRKAAAEKELNSFLRQLFITDDTALSVGLFVFLKHTLDALVRI